MVVKILEKKEVYKNWIAKGLNKKQAFIATQQAFSPIPEGLNKGMDFSLDCEDKALLALIGYDVRIDD